MGLTKCTAAAYIILSSILILNADVKPNAADPESKTEIIEINTRDLHQVFDQALADFNAKDLESSADHLKEASTVVSDESKKASAKQKKALKDNSQALRTLASQVRDGRVKTSKDLTELFAKTHHALASHYVTESVNSKSKKRGNFILGAVLHAEKAAELSEYTMEPTTATSIESAREVGTNLTKGEAVVPAKVKAGVTGLHKACVAIGSHIESKGKSSGKAKKR